MRILFILLMLAVAAVVGWDRHGAGGGGGVAVPAEESLWATFSEARRAVQRLDPGHVSGGEFVAHNPGEQISAWFSREGVRLSSGRSGNAWEVTLKVAGHGAAQALRAEGQRVELDHGGGLLEWFENREEGIEQGFIVQDKPDGETVEVGLELEGLRAVSAGGGDLQFVDGDGTAVLAYTGLKAWDGFGRLLGAEMRPANGGLVIEVDARGAEFPVTIDPLISAIPAMLGPEVTGPGDAMDRFGASVALDGSTAVIGADGDNGTGGAGTGSAYVFVREDGWWILEGKLEAGDAAEGDRFGAAVSVDGETVVVGAPGDDTSAGVDAGSAYVFVRSAGVWSEEEKLEGSGNSAGDQFGGAVAVQGDTAVAGAWQDDPVGEASGSAYVFVRSGTLWSEQEKLVASDAVTGKRLGGAVSLDGETVVVGANGGSEAPAGGEGAAYVFVRSGTTWSEEAILQAADGGADDRFGFAVALQSDRVVIGAPGDDASAGPGTGSAYVFERVGTVWSEKTKLEGDEGEGGDDFGHAVALSFNTAFVGAPGDAAGAGTVRGFQRRPNGFWNEELRLEASAPVPGEGFGRVVTLEIDTALVGTPDAAGIDTAGAPTASQGHVHVFRVGIIGSDSDSDGASNSWENANGFDDSDEFDLQTADSDGDGELDIYELAQGTGRDDPLSVFGLQIVPPSAPGVFRVRYFRNKVVSGLVSYPRWSVTLGRWHPGGASADGVRVEMTETVIQSQPDFDLVEATATVTVGATDRLFIALEVIPVE